MKRAARRPRRHPFRWPVEALLLRAAVWILCALPERTASELGARFGRLLARFDLRHRERALANLRTAYPERSEPQRLELLRAAFEELGRTASEWARLPTLTPEQRSARFDWRGAEHLERALVRGSGVLLVSAHYGSWELVPAALRARFPDREITAVAREMPNPRLQAAFSRRRNLGGGETLPQQARAIVKALRRNAVVGVLADQYLSQRRGGILVPFFGKRAWTNPGPATLALRTGAAIVPLYAERVVGGGIRVACEPEIEVPRSGDRSADIRELTRRINLWLEERIRAQPERWLWMHRRWHHSPDAPDLYGRRLRRR